MKTTLATIARLAAERELPFLLVGGNAVIFWGVPRFTRDIDLMITDVYRDAWRALIGELGYTAYHQVDAFEQFEAPPPEPNLPHPPPIDLMLVDAPTWDKLYPASKTFELGGGATARIPDAIHLIAMKLNASKNPHRRADASDLQDVVSLIKACHIDVSGSEFAAVAERYASPGDLEWIRRAFSNHE